MGLGFLPWERWLPPYIFGPLLCAISVAGLLFYRPLAWWVIVLMPITAVWSAWGTWVWFKTGRNVFNDKADKSSRVGKEGIETRQDKS